MTAPLSVQRRAEQAGEDRRDGVVTGPLWPSPYRITVPRSGGAGSCSHHPPDSCAWCDGSLADMREAARLRRTSTPSVTTTGATL